MEHAKSLIASAWPSDFTALPLLLTSEHVARLRGTTERTVERERCEGSGIPFIKWGRRIFYRRDDVLKFLNERTFTSTAEAKKAAASRVSTSEDRPTPAPVKKAKRLSARPLGEVTRT